MTDKTNTDSGLTNTNIFVARQPILNKKKKLFAYELLFRDGLSNAFPEMDGDMASSKLVAGSFLSFGLDELLMINAYEKN